MGIAVLVFGVLFLLIASGGLLLFYREEMIERLSAVVNPRPKQGTRLNNTLEQTRSSLTGVLQQFERALPKSEAEVSVIQQRMIRAGFRKESAVKRFYGAKVVVPIALCIAAFSTGLGSLSPFFVYAMALGLGFLGPDFWLGNRIKARQAKIRRGLPDALDLLIICIEAGLGLDQATARTAEELHLSQPVISDELGIVVLEQRAGRARGDAWRHLADRTSEESVANVVAVLVQSEKFGTSIAKSLRVHSETLRTQRRQKVEEMAAKTTVKLVFPLVLFIFPSIFLVTLGPAVIIMMESFNSFLAH